MKKARLAVGVVVVLVTAVVGWGAWRQMRPRPPETELPKFSEVPAGARAPTAKAMGLTVGKSTLPEVEAMLTAKGVTCADTSARALMRAAREKKLQELEEKKARGESVDAVSSASLVKKRSPKEKNPQVRLTCNDAPADLMGDRQRTGGKGRWLFIFDSPEHPLRHVSFRRTQPDQNAALEDFSSTIGAMTSTFGEPQTVSMDLPVPPADGATTELFPKLLPFKREWAFADLAVKVTALSYGRRGVDILESVEVPWPVRSDAPFLPPTAAVSKEGSSGVTAAAGSSGTR